MKDYGIIFDCDGTLVNSLNQALESFNYALECVGERPRNPEEIKKYFGAAGDRILIQLLGDERKGLEAFEYFVDHQSQLASEMSLHPGILDLLELASQNQVPMSIVTGRHERDLEVVLQPHHISDYFVALVADNHLPHSKPAPDGILLAASRMGLDPKRTIYVGDSTVDIRAAHAAGAGSVAALWDQLVKPEAMRLENPHYLAETPKDVWSSFQKFSGY